MSLGTLSHKASNFTNLFVLRSVGGSGTLDWTPPEAWERDPKTQRLHPPDRSTDLWSLGTL